MNTKCHLFGRVKNVLALALLCIALLVVTLPVAVAAEQAVEQKADAVLVLKSKRMMRLLKGGRTLRQYSISLGKQPVGDKVYEGDQRTPEGRYTLDWRNDESKYYRSMHVSYPNNRDTARARSLGKSPGGNIMIHGRPNKLSDLPFLFEDRDWTDGCIAVSDREMDEIWVLVDDGTPIVILP